MTYDEQVPTRDGAVVAIPMQRWIKRIFVSCIIIEALLVVGDFVFNYVDVLDDRSIRRIWNLARENSVPTWFSSMQAHALGATGFLIAAVQRGRIARWRFWGWILVGSFFIWIGIDDFAELHEKLGGALERMAEKGGERGGLVGLLLKNPSFSWHTFIAPAFALGGLCIVGFLWTTFWRHGLCRYLVLGFGLWVVSQGLDYLEGLDNIDDYYEWIREKTWVMRSYGVPHTSKVIEEVMEMFGTTLLWIGFLKYLAIQADGLSLRFERESEQDA